MEQPSYRKYKTIALVSIFVTALIAGTFILLTGFVFRPRATAGIPRLNFSVSNTSDATQAEKPYDLILKVNPNGASFYAFELYFSYDPSKVELQNANPAENISSNYLIATSSINTTTGEVSIVGARTGTPFSGTDDQEIARLKVKVKQGATGEYKYEWKNNTKLGNNLNVDLEHSEFVIGPEESASLYLTIPALIPSPSPGAGQVIRGSNLDSQIYLKTNGNFIKSVDVVLPYDDSRISFQTMNDLVQNIVINPDSGFDSQFVLKNINPTVKKITIALVAPSVNQTPTPVQGGSDILLATVTFKVKADAPLGEASLMIDQSSKIYNMQTQNIFKNPGGTGFTIVEAVPVTLPPLTGDPGPYLLNLKLKFQGILRQPSEDFNKMKVKISVVAPLGNKGESSSEADFVSDEKGIWSGSVKVPPFFAFPSKGFKLFVKGPKHIQKRICANTPSESFPGTYHCENGQIELVGGIGINDLDFSGIYMLVGDLPQQDGIVNSYDISLVRNNIGSSDRAVLALADLNLDGIVDTQDYSLVIAALSVRSDEGE